MTTKTLKNHYSPATSDNWYGRQDSAPHERLFQVIQCLNLNTEPQASAAGGLAFLGFASDVGVTRNSGRPGASKGPTQLRCTLGNLVLPEEFSKTVWDVGDVTCDGDLEAAQQVLGEAVRMTREKGIQTIVLGGGHETAFGHYLGLNENMVPDFGIINIDAHFDMRPLVQGQSTSGTPFLQIAQHRKSQNLPFHYCCVGVQETANTTSLKQTAQAWNVETISAETIHAQGVETVLPSLRAFILPLKHIYLSICLDAIASSYAPGVSAPQVYGLLPWHVRWLVRDIMASGKLVSLDIVEYAPILDQENRTAQVAAGLVYEVLSA